MNARLLNHTTKFLLVIALGAISALACTSARADGKAASVDIHAETPVPTLCGTVNAVAGEVRLLDSSRAHLDDAIRGSGVACGGWISVQVGWVEIKHRDGHVVRVGEGSFVQFAGEGETLQVLRGLVHVQSFDDGSELRMATPNARARMKFGAGMLIYDPEQRRSQWVTLDRMAAFENRFEEDSQVVVGAGESSMLDLSKPRVSPAAPKAITVASLKPILRALDIPEKKRDQAIRVALERQRRVIPASLAGKASRTDMRAPASQGASIQDRRGDYHRHAPSDQDAKIERHLAAKLTGGAPRSMLEPEPDPKERHLNARLEARDRAERQRIIRELEALEE